MGIYIIRDNKFVYTNPAFEKIFGYGRDELIGVDPISLVHPDDRAMSAENLRRRVTGEIKAVRYEMRCLRKDGQTIFVELLGSAVKLDGKIVVIGNILDVTERNRMERELIITEEQQAGIFRESPVPLLVSALKTGRFIEVNEALRQLLGAASVEEFVGKTAVELGIIPRSDRKRLAQTVTAKGHVTGAVTKMRRLNGEPFVAELSIKPFEYEGEKFLLTSIVDITQRKQAEERLKESEARFRNYFEMPLMGMAMSSPEKGWISANDRLCAMLGYSLEELRQRTWADLTHPDDLAANVDLFNRMLAGEIDNYSMEKRFIRKDGQIIWTIIAVGCVRKADGSMDHACLSVQDITERKNTEASLKLFREMMDESVDGIEILDLETGRFLDVSESFCQSHGYSRQEILSMCVRDLNVSEKTSWQERAAMVRAAGHVTLEAMHRRKDGSTFPVEVTVKYVKLDREYLLAVVRDVTERKVAGEKLRQLSQAVEQSPVSIMITDPSGRIEYVNPMFSEVTGYSFEEAVGKNPRILKSGELTQDTYKNLWQTITSGKTWTGVFHNRKKGGELFWERAAISPMLDAAGQIAHFLSVKEDITQQRILEEQLRQVQKMEAIGKLAGGVAHDFNNILAIIQIQADLLKASNGVSAEQLEFAHGISNAANRAAALTRQLLLFSRKGTLQLRDLDLNASVNDTARMLGRVIGENIKVQLRFALERLFIRADAGMIDQVLMNLVVNARDAMPDGGQLVIETSAEEIDELTVAQYPQARTGSFVCLTVCDTGTGIPAEVIPRIFEPFFTTKEAGKGTGLGLATVYSIVQQHRGWINVRSEPGKGSTFRIYLPRITKKAELPPTQRSFNSTDGGCETILLVEDDPALRTSLGMTLTQLGYMVIEAANGEEALEVWKTKADSIQLLLTDLLMPGGMNGKDLASQLLNRKPGLKVIYISGYSADVIGKDFPLRDGVNFLSKPFQALKLASTIRRSLDKV